MRELSRRAIQDIFLSNQCLDTPAETVEQAIDRILGCRGAEGSTPYLSLFWRVKDFHPEDFDAAVHQHRRILRVRGPRGTYYWVSVSQAPMFIGAYRPASPRLLFEPWGMSEREYLTIREEVQLALMGGDVKPLSDLKAVVSGRLQRQVSKGGAPPSGTLQVTLEVMQSLGELTALKEPGFDRHQIDEYYGDKRDVTRPNLYGLVSNLYPMVSAQILEPAVARRQLLYAYIRTFGPVTIEDMAWWTGWNKGEIKQLLMGIQPEATQVSLKGLSGNYWWVLPEATYSPEDSTSVHLLPGGDSAIKGYSVFGRFLHESCLDGNLLRFNPVTLFSGVGRGNWGYRRSNGHVDVVLSLFATPTPDEAAAVEAAAYRIGQNLIARTGEEVRCHITKQVGPWKATDAFPTDGMK